jgi:hypothetical protein
MLNGTEGNGEACFNKSETYYSILFATQGSSPADRRKLSLTQRLQTQDSTFELDATTKIKTWVFDDWSVPSLGSGRTIVDLGRPLKLELVRTTNKTGAKTLYMAIEANLRVWNPSLAHHQAVLSACILDVNQNFIFGTFPSRSGVNTFMKAFVMVQDDIFDAAHTARLDISLYTFRYY